MKEELNKDSFLNSAHVSQGTFMPEGRFGLINGIKTFIPKK